MGKVRFRLQGGLGNQLFIYHAALADSILNQNEFEFETSALKTAHSKREFSLDDFVLPKKCVTVQERMPRMRKVLEKILIGYPSHKKYSVFEETGYSEQLLLNSYRNISGYFQSWRYAEIVHSRYADKPIKVLEPSDWASDLANLAKVQKPIACHIRRGDYVDLSDAFGILNYDYYLNAINNLRTLGVLGPVWIFTDSPDQIDESFVAKISGFLIREPKISKPSDVFHVMQSCESFVISNSTFSWWAAYLANSTHVMAPSPWFRNLDEPVDLIPQGWHKLESQWSNI